ncbi:MAG: HAMP domain-containing sensor histidine kinase [Bacteroidales bacterium]|nr:HAMP domain-containing sensor histidine kinase [Bacteroidales bacterium]
MNFLNNLTKVVVVIIALAFTIIIGQIVPKNQFVPYRLELDSTWAKEPAIQDYLVDLNNDHHYENIRHKSINKSGNSLDFKNDVHFRMIHIFDKKEFFISRYLKFADVNQDGSKEIIFLSAMGRAAFLNILEFEFDSLMFLHMKRVKQIKVDSITFANDKPDAINHSLIINKSDIWFDIQAGYSIQPRNTYKYNFETEKLIKTSDNSIVIDDHDLMTWQGRDYLLAKSVVAAGNTVSPEESEMLKSSNDPDTIGFYEFTKDKVYSYGDFGSYILLYDHNLDFAFEPIEFIGWTNFTKSEFIQLGGFPHILAITNTQKGDSSHKAITICSFDGEIVKQVPMTNDYRNVFANNGIIVFEASNALHICNDSLEFIRKTPDILHSSGFFDLDGNREGEFIAFSNNELLVFASNFSVNASYRINQEFAPYPENNRVEILKKDGKSCFLFNTRLFYYLFSYEKNEWAILKYPFYIMTFLFWSVILFVLLRYNIKRLEKEKRHLEEVVTERTTELLVKNNELLAKNEKIQKNTVEIQMQADEILQQYERLEKLDQFKETLTHALVHDLKNPLSQILLNTSDRAVNLPARKMLRLITNMLDVEKYEKAGFILNKEPLSLRNIIAEVINGQEAGLKEKNLEVHLQFTDFKILADKEVIVRVFDNLLSNAVRYSPLNQSIVIKAEPSDDGMLHISMKNYGDPIPTEALPYIFDKYRHFGKTESGAHRSTGLGLTFCKMAVEAHGGTIGALNNPDQGCSFWFTLQHISHNIKPEENETILPDLKPKWIPTETEKENLKEVVNKMKAFKIFEISRFHEVLDPLKATAGSNINEWISCLFRAINIQNEAEYNRLINLMDDEQTKNTDR